ncbi:hypothetical protein MKZ38_007150 [Zalerion maritima]|uniref:BTB domain-containing protein n=1 Tax=Zalerion maritima TaxID=339359 RepID=A0AAD5WUA5_9PEZI|nr:hypothetical protein MKZ38_007150 [Zalerion maritima]
MSSLPSQDDGWVTICADGDEFVVRRDLLVSKSDLFRNYFEATGDKTQVIRLDSNARILQHIVSFMRRGTFPFFFNGDGNLDIPMYNELLAEASYLGVRVLEHYVRSGDYMGQRVSFPPYDVDGDTLRLGAVAVSQERAREIAAIKAAAPALEPSLTNKLEDSASSGGDEGHGMCQLAGRAERLVIPEYQQSPYNGSHLSSQALSETIPRMSGANNGSPGPLVGIDYLAGRDSVRFQCGRRLSARKEIFRLLVRKVENGKCVCAASECDPKRRFRDVAACKDHIRATHQHLFA